MKSKQELNRREIQNENHKTALAYEMTEIREGFRELNENLINIRRMQNQNRERPDNLIVQLIIYFLRQPQFLQMNSFIYIITLAFIYCMGLRL